MEGERGSTFYGEWTISSHRDKGRCLSFSGRMTFSSFYVTTFSNGPLLEVPSYSVGGGVTDSWENIYLYHGQLIGSFAW